MFAWRPCSPKQNHFLSSGQCQGTALVAQLLCGTMPQPRYSWDGTRVSHKRQRQQPLSSERPPLKPVYTRASTRHETSGQQCLPDVHQPEIPERLNRRRRLSQLFPSLREKEKRRANSSPNIPNGQCLPPKSSPDGPLRIAAHGRAEREPFQVQAG